jgi:hypothetical protein
MPAARSTIGSGNNVIVGEVQDYKNRHYIGFHEDTETIVVKFQGKV